MNLPQIPTYIVEEHHEVFIAWNNAILDGNVSPANNVLYHFDEHSDLSTPQFNSDINQVKGNLRKIRQFTYKELNISTFIIPVVYLGIINEVFWFKYRDESVKKDRNCYVRSYNNDGMKLLSGDIEKLNPHEIYTDIRKFKLCQATPDFIIGKDDVLLDIDLDFFSCAGNPKLNEEVAIEITKEEFDKFKADKYSKIKYCGVSKVDTYKENDKYYYLINYFKHLYPCKLRKTPAEIKERIYYFIYNLKNRHIIPSVITICRSRYSGYTPEDQWELIENELLSGLKNLYQLKFKNI